MGLHHLRRRGAQLGRDVVPGGVEQRRARALAALQRRDELSLAVELVVSMYSAIFAAGSVTQGPWPGQISSRSSSPTRRSDSR